MTNEFQVVQKLHLQQVWSGGNGWQRDTFLRFECLDTEIPCCERIALVASPKGLANTWQPAR